MERLILAILGDAWPEAMTSTQLADALLDAARSEHERLAEASR